MRLSESVFWDHCQKPPRVSKLFPKLPFKELNTKQWRTSLPACDRCSALAYHREMCRSALSKSILWCTERVVFTKQFTRIIKSNKLREVECFDTIARVSSNFSLYSPTCVSLVIPPPPPHGCQSPVLNFFFGWIMLWYDWIRRISVRII